MTKSAATRAVTSALAAAKVRTCVTSIRSVDVSRCDHDGYRHIIATYLDLADPSDADRVCAALAGMPSLLGAPDNRHGRVTVYNS